MRILLLIKRFNFGGSENHACELANTLAENGHEVWLLSRKGRQVQRLSRCVHFYPFNLSDVGLLSQLIQLRKFILLHDIQLIHAHQRLAIKIASLAGKLFSIPTVATVHGQTRHDLGAYIYRKCLTRVIFVSNQVLYRAGRFRELRNKSVFIPNSIGDMPRIENVLSGQIVYMSRLDKRHGALLLMIIEQVLPELERKYPHVRLNIFGDGRMFDEVQQAANRFNERVGACKVSCAGFKSETVNCLDGAALLLGVGRVAAQALSQGVPVLSVNNRHLGSLVSITNFTEFMQNNFVDVKGAAPTAYSLTVALTHFLANELKLKLQAKTLRASVKQHLHQNHIVRQIEFVYHEILDENYVLNSPDTTASTALLPKAFLLSGEVLQE